MQPPADASVFQFSNNRYWYMVFGLVVFAAFTGLSLALPLFIRRFWLISVPSAAFFVPFTTFLLLYVRCLRDSVSVSSDGIWYLPKNGNCTFLGWSEVASMKDDEFAGVYQRLVLVDATGNRKIRLDYQLENFERLRELVIQHTVAARCRPVRVFHRTWYSKLGYVFLVMLFLCFSILSYSTPGVQSRMFLGIAVICLVPIARDPTGVELSPDAIVVIYPVWRRSIPFNTISGIHLTNRSYRSNYIVATVTIQTLKDESIELQRFREGIIALYQGLLSAWKTAGGIERPTGLADL